MSNAERLTTENANDDDNFVCAPSLLYLYRFLPSLLKKIKKIKHGGHFNLEVIVS